MKNINGNQVVKRFVILILGALMMSAATGCRQDSGVGAAPTPMPTPAPPGNYFPDVLGKLKLSSEPRYGMFPSEKCDCQHFEALYANENIEGKYHIEIYKSPEEARRGFSAKKYLEPSSEIIKESETETAAITKMTGSVITARIAGANLITVIGRKDAAVNIENNLPYQLLGIARKPPPRKIEEFLETPVLTSSVQKEFETNQPAATKKYGANFVFLKGRVADYGDDVETKTVTATTPAKQNSTSSSESSRIFLRSIRSERRRRTNNQLSKLLRSTPTPKAAPISKTTETHRPFVVLELPGEDRRAARNLVLFRHARSR